MKTIVAAAIAALLIGAVALPASAASAPYLVKNIKAGSESSWPVELTALGDLVIFTASGGGAGRELWRSDGTSAGTYRLRDIRPGGKTSHPRGLVTVGDQVLFAANDGPHGQELWVTDGTTAGTHLVKDIAPGTDMSMSMGGDSPIAVDVAGVAFLGAISDGLLWRSDGTEAGTYPVPGSPAFVSQPISFNNRAYFTANGKLWRSDGTAQGTKKVVNSTGKVVKAPVEVVATDSLLFFQYESTKLWRTDGTRAGTYKILDNGPGCIGSLCDLTYLTAAGNLVFFMPHGVPGIQVWRSDGTPTGTFSIAQPDSGSSDMFHAVGDRMYIFMLGDVWVSDGSVDGTRVVELPPEIHVWWVFDVAGELYFAALADGDSMPTLFSSDGTAEGTVQLGPPRPGFPFELTVAGDRVFFRGEDARGSELWAMDL